jgi:DNA-binding transcriptional MerR regulator
MYRPKEVAEQLAISAASLRHWSNEFADYLSPAAQKQITGKGTSAQRRYTDHDIVVFTKVKQLLSDGNTYEEVLRRLQAEPLDESGEDILEASRPAPNGVIEEDSLVVHQTLDLSSHPVFTAFREALEAKDETIRAKDEVIESKDVTIKALEARIDEIKNQPAPQPVVQAALVRFKWDFLNRLLLDSETHGDSR